MTSELTFDSLRAANVARLPQFKNRKGEPAHSQPDGSDWCLAQWCNAVTGELGEAANIIKKIERGDLTLEEARQGLADELADVQTYLDLLAFRAGVDLGKATIRKWNAVSERVGCDLKLAAAAPVAAQEGVEREWPDAPGVWSQHGLLYEANWNGRTWHGDGTCSPMREHPLLVRLIGDAERRDRWYFPGDKAGEINRARGHWLPCTVHVPSPVAESGERPDFDERLARLEGFRADIDGALPLMNRATFDLNEKLTRFMANVDSTLTGVARQIGALEKRESAAAAER